MILENSVSGSDWSDWKWQMQNRVTRLSQAEKYFVLSDDERAAFAADESRLPFAITPYYLSLMLGEGSDGPLRRTLVPTRDEFLVSPGENADPLGEDPHRPVPAIVHRYPDRVLFLATGNCAVYCRYCTRSRLVGQPEEYRFNRAEWEHGFEYIASNPAIRDVLITGGDPLTLSDEVLDELLSRLRAIPHVEFIRIGTKVPFALPQRVTSGLVSVLKKYHPLWMSLHVIHPKELTAESARACAMLADAGIPLGSQTVLLRGVNDNIADIRELMLGLLRVRVKPYYLFHCDPLAGSAHFRTEVSRGVELIEGLRGHVTGYAIPHYAIDIAGEGGKVTLGPQYFLEREGDFLVVKNYAGNRFLYPDGGRVV
jgi:lysine 2,3-aminomutase